MFIQTENTPNPLTLKFIPEMDILENDNTLEFKNKKEANSSPLAKKIFENDSVTSVFLAKNFITVTKKEKLDWEIVKPDILSKIMDFLSSEVPIIDDDPMSPSFSDKIIEKFDEKDKGIVDQIKSLLDEKIKPAVAMDGGDIQFSSYESGVVYLKLRGSCAGCPSSTLTLKSGIENMLKYYIPEIKSVEASN